MMLLANLFLKAEDYMLPCMNKKLLGMECFGCGLQRSVALILQGEFVAAFEMYPAIYTLILMFAVIAINFFTKYNISTKVVAALGILNALIIVISYFIKIN